MLVACRAELVEHALAAALIDRASVVEAHVHHPQQTAKRQRGVVGMLLLGRREELVRAAEVADLHQPLRERNRQAQADLLAGRRERERALEQLARGHHVAAVARMACRGPQVSRRLAHHRAVAGPARALAVVNRLLEVPARELLMLGET